MSHALKMANMKAEVGLRGNRSDPSGVFFFIMSLCLMYPLCVFLVPFNVCLHNFPAQTSLGRVLKSCKYILFLLNFPIF